MIRCHRPSILILAVVLLLGSAAGAAIAASDTSQFWTDVSPASIAPAGLRLTIPDHFRALEVDHDALAYFLSLVPLERTPEATYPSVIALPLPQGGFGRFAIVESPVMAPALQARYPDIRTYGGYGLDDRTATCRLDLTPVGFHALILGSDYSIYIDPYQRGDVIHYQSYFRKDLTSPKELGGCTVLDPDHMSEQIHRWMQQNPEAGSGTQLRTYRLALAADGEYTIFQGGTIPLALAAMTTSMNRVDGVYLKDLSIFMQMIPNEDLIIYTNPNTDPYTNNNGEQMLGQNQANLDAVIGNANYDVGHVFSTGGGGISGLGVVCRTGQKAQSVTGSLQPTGDGFDIDYVAHEMGHEFGANHTFNSDFGSCGGGNRNASTAYEPGSGSTIMAYAGICGEDNLQQHSDDYFHWISIQEITAYSQQGYGNNCAVITPTGVVIPVVHSQAGGFTIPIGTPFTLNATAVTNGTPTFCWEESDLGPAGHPDSPSGNAPIFRTFKAVTSGARTFPKISDIVNNHHTIGELLPTYARNLTFKVTVRDTQAGGVGVSNDAIAFSVAAGGPFQVTYPDTSTATWPATTQQTVTWNVAGTNTAPVSCAHVNIMLSTDGGFTWPTTLLSGAPNNGSALITVPNAPTDSARVMVAAADNVFFDISNHNFTITDITGVNPPSLASPGLSLSANHPNPFTPETTISFRMPQAGEAALRIYDAAGRLVRSLVTGQMGAGGHQAVWDGLDDSGRPVSSGVYLYKLSALGTDLKGQMTLIR